MKKILLVIVFLLVAVVFVSNTLNTTSVDHNAEKAETTQLGFEDIANTELAAPYGPVHP
ncbi:hypothetical protein [Acholeplasma granularum]|uniref:hypothetical protein n=1 Tax=Acholeplasma granularum TaxID=264635 RepID=UPI0004B128F1|nr:hypothetical protein [Acholeplasma granularum]